jgi:tight adherence protein B
VIDSELIPLVAPLAVFMVIVLFGAGVYRIANQGGLLARRRLAAFAPASSGQAAIAVFEGSPLFKRQRFSSIDALDRLLARKDYGARLSVELARAGLPLRVGEYLLIRCVLALALVFEVRNQLGSLPVGLVAGLLGYFLPPLYVRFRQGKRLRQFDDQLVDALVMMANALKSGYSFLQAMEAISREMPEPIGVEFEQALREIRVGGAVEDALGGIHRRIKSADFELVVTAMVIQRQVGGNLTEILANIAYTIRERHRILREIRVLTAQERLSGYVIAGLPAALIVLLAFLSPDYIHNMWNDFSGKLLLGGGFVMQMLGLLVIRKIVDIEV